MVMQTKFMALVRNWMVTMLVAGLVLGLGACAGGGQPAASAPVAAAQAGAQTSAKINTKITQLTIRQNLARAPITCSWMCARRKSSTAGISLAL